MSDWDDLFRAAAGDDDDDDDGGNDIEIVSKVQKIETYNNPTTRKHHQISSPNTTSSNSNSSEKNLNNKRNKKKKSRSNTITHEQEQPLESFLHSRSEIIIWKQLPSWLSPGASLCNNSNSNSTTAVVCSQWEEERDDDDDDDDDDEYSDLDLNDAKCKNCKLSILHHSLSVTPSIEGRGSGAAAVMVVLKAFALVRDIRCCCSSILNDTTNNINDYTITALNKSILLRKIGVDIRSIIPSGESNILIRKFNKIKHGATSLNERSKFWVASNKKMDKNKHYYKLSGIFDEIIQLMIYCDDVYYRMYYLQNSGYLPIANKNICIPHPPTYFGSNNITWDAGKDHVKELAGTMKKLTKKSCTTTITDKRWDDLMGHFGVDNDDKLPTHNSELVHEDPLSYMHKNRLSESIFIFHKSSWIHSRHTKKQTIESMSSHHQKLLKLTTRDQEELFYTTHDTPAPMIIKEWRDSCRDLLCNLYAYATISPRTIKAIKETIRKGNNNNITCNNIVEMGAGTGYIAHLLNTDLDLNVSAFDVAPTKTRNYGEHEDNNNHTNEYHGSSPPFCHVNYADSKDVRSILGKREAKDTALLLCYPPPLSSMAEDSLKSFVKLGGNTFIHIGEFSGLTGSSQFEHFLTLNFDLIYRAPCFHWGTDASEVTIWSKKCEGRVVDKSNNPVVLVQCSQCKSIKATLRCRLCRPLSYCSSSCFDAHKAERRVHFAFNMIPDIINQNDLLSERGGFGSKQYFESI